jgi:hypothetical protein
VHICIPNNFCNQCFFSFHIKKCISYFLGGQRGRNGCFFVKGHQGQCAKHHHSNFHGWGPTRDATSRWLGIISACCHIMNYFCPNSILIQFCTRATRNTNQKIHGGPLGVWDSRTKTKTWFPPHLADIDGTVSLT